MHKYQVNYDFHTRQRQHMLRYELNPPLLSINEVKAYSLLALVLVFALFS